MIQPLFLAVKKIVFKGDDTPTVSNDNIRIEDIGSFRTWHVTNDKRFKALKLEDCVILYMKKKKLEDGAETSSVNTDDDGKSSKIYIAESEVSLRSRLAGMGVLIELNEGTK